MKGRIAQFPTTAASIILLTVLPAIHAFARTTPMAPYSHGRHSHAEVRIADSPALKAQSEGSQTCNVWNQVREHSALETRTERTPDIQSLTHRQHSAAHSARGNHHLTKQTFHQWLPLNHAFGAKPNSLRTAPLGQFDGQTDVGKVNQPGSAVYDDEKQEYTISGSGSNMWADHDEFHFVWKRMKGDFILTARAAFIGKGVEAHRKIGWIIRSSLDPDATQVSAVVHGEGLTSLQFRRSKGTATEEMKSSVTAPDVVQLERKGNKYVMAVARFGEPFVTEQVEDVALGDDVYVGLFVCAHNNNVIEKATFSNVRITIPANDDFVPYKDYIGSNLEILDVESGHRKVVYRVSDSLQAPNWTRDGKALIYNRNGRLYRFHLARNSPVEIDTGPAVNNNNDHVLSFDGKWIGISNHSKEDENKSIVYVLPVAGGTPRRITSQGPSYLHGWSPDGKSLIYTGERHGEFDIYKMSISGGEETRLTTAPGLDDGSEYSPDGKYIYFNSARTGTMQIWRMNPDGTNQQQITNDEYNNWFPHISPNGRWICFLSFSKDVAASDHPFYKRVYIRLMPIAGQPKVIAYIYGGQGTMNVPSWSPEGRRIAFVSNTN